MPKRTRTPSTSRRDAKANGASRELDVKQTLLEIAADKKAPPTARVSALRMLDELEEAARNRAAWKAAGL